MSRYAQLHVQHQLTVKANEVVAWYPAPVAVISTLDVTGLDVTGLVVWVAAPPQPMTTTLNTDSVRYKAIRAGRLLAKPKQQIVQANPKLATIPGGMRIAPIFLGVVMVRTLDAADPLAVSVAGEKRQAAPVGSPEHTKVIAELNPYCGVTLIVVLALWPELTVADVGEAASVKLAAGRV
jgi:hypothetical protein